MNDGYDVVSPLAAMNYDLSSRTIQRLVIQHCLPAAGDSLPHVLHLIDEYLSPFLCHEIFTTACEEGVSEHTLELLLERTTPAWRRAVCGAVQGGHLHVLVWMTERQDGRGPWKADFDYTLLIAATHGHFDVVKWLYERGIDEHTFWDLDQSAPGYIEKTWLLGHCSCITLEFAAEHGYLELVQWIYNNQTDYCIAHSHAMDKAVANGHLTTAQWLHSVNAISCSTHAADEAANHGHLEILQWLQSNQLLRCTTYAMDGAAENGHLQVMKWLHETHTAGFSRSIFYHAAKNGHLEVVEWLYENIDTYLCSYGGARIAANNGHLKVLQWFHTHFPNLFSNAVMNGAAKNGHLNVAMWLHEYRTEGCSEMAPVFAASGGHLEVVQWLSEHYPDTFGPQAMDEAAKNGYLHIVQWLHVNRREGCTPYAMEFAAYNGHLDVVLYLLEHRDEGFSSDAMTNSRDIEVHCLFSTSDNIHLNSRFKRTNRAQLNMLQSVFKTRPSFVQGCLKCLADIAIRTTNIDMLDWVNQFGLELRSSAPIRDAVIRGDVKLLQWFHRNGFEVCDPDLLELAVENGRLDTTRWLSKLGYEINSLDFVEMARRTTNMPLLRWLVEHGPPLNLPLAIELAMEYRHVEIMSWVSESVRVQVVLEALQKEDLKVLWWILTRTQSEDESSRQCIRDGIHDSNLLLWFQENLVNVAVCSWCFTTARKRRKLTTLRM